MRFVVLVHCAASDEGGESGGGQSPTSSGAAPSVLSSP